MCRDTFHWEGGGRFDNLTNYCYKEQESHGKIVTNSLCSMAGLLTNFLAISKRIGGHGTPMLRQSTSLIIGEIIASTFEGVCDKLDDYFKRSNI